MISAARKAIPAWLFVAFVGAVVIATASGTLAVIAVAVVGFVVFSALVVRRGGYLPLTPKAQGLRLRGSARVKWYAVVYGTFAGALAWVVLLVWTMAINGLAFLAALVLTVLGVRLVGHWMQRRGEYSVRASIIIDAPPADVWRVAHDPANLEQLAPSLIEHRDITDLPNGEHSCTQVIRTPRGDVTFRVVSRRLESELRTEVTRTTATTTVRGSRRYVAVDTGTLVESEARVEVISPVSNSKLDKFAAADSALEQTQLATLRRLCDEQVT